MEKDIWRRITSDEIITDYNTKAVNAYVDAYQRRDNNSDTAGKVDNETRQQMNNLLQRLCSVRFFLLSIACEQALLFGRAKRAAREREGERRSREGPAQSRLLSRASRACTFHDIPQMESLLAGYVVKKASLVICNGLFSFSHRTSQVEPKPLLLDTIFKSSTLPW